MLNVNNKLWLISDTHFGHKNIVSYCQRPEAHEIIMLDHWIRLVRPEDQVLHLGDVCFANASRWQTIIGHLPGEKYLIKGNHDKKSNEFYEACGFTIVPEFIHNNHSFTHRPATDLYPGPEGDWEVNIHGHIHNNGYRTQHDGIYDASKKYINISVEATDLKPIQLGAIWKR